MKSVTVNLSFQDTLLTEIDEEARRESRSRSELIREAARQYMDRQNRWQQLFAVGDQITRTYGLREKDVDHEVETVRSGNRRRI